MARANKSKLIIAALPKSALWKFTQKEVKSLRAQFEFA
jgi:hypothetical protein